MREQLQRFTDQIFFRRTLEYQKIIKEVTRLIISVTDLKILFRLIDRTIVRAMCIKHVAVLLLEERVNRFLVEKTQGIPSESIESGLAPDSALASYLIEKKDAVVLEEVQSLLAGNLASAAQKNNLAAVAKQLEGLGAAVAIPSFSKDKMVGILCLGEKLSGEPYSPDDLELLLTMASEAGIAIENAKLYRDVTETRDYLNSLVQGSDDAILTMNIQGKLLSWNNGAQKILGYSAAEVLGKIPPIFEPNELNRWIEKILRAEDVKAIELNKINKKGQALPLLLTFSPIRDTAGKIIGISAIIKDITELRKVDQLKHEFLAVVSHELRTPLTPIKGYLSLLLQGVLGELQPKQKEVLTTILNQSNHLHDLIDSVIDISRIEAGRGLELQKEPIFLEDVINEGISSINSAAKAKNINVITVFPPTRMAILADRNKIVRTIDNLLGNAIKFTPNKGSIKVTLTKENKRIRVSIEDTGIGIAENHLEDIFKSFYQIDTSYTRSSGGIGMGLTIAREIINAHDGRIWAESEGLGKGAKISFEL